LTTSIIHDSSQSFCIDLDFIGHIIRLKCNDGEIQSFQLQAESVASFYQRFMKALAELGIAVRINEKANEVLDSIPFSRDEEHCSYDPEFANRFWRSLLQADRVMKRFRSDFVGKVSPVHFFWGSNDLAVTRFSGRRAPEHPGGVPNLPDLVTKEAYSHEVSSCGFWPGNAQVPYAAFYSYAYPKPAGFELAQVTPKEAFFHELLREFILPYEIVRASSNPDQVLLEFLQSTYEAAANLGKWDRKSLEDSPFLKTLQQKDYTKIRRAA